MAESANILLEFVVSTKYNFRGNLKVVFKSVKSLSINLDKIVKRERCVGFVCVTVIYVITVVKDCRDKVSVFTFRQIFRNRTFVEM